MKEIMCLFETYTFINPLYIHKCTANLPAKTSQNTIWKYLNAHGVSDDWMVFTIICLVKRSVFLSGQDTLISSGWCRFGQPVPVTEPKTSRVPKHRIPAGSGYVVSSHARANVQAWTGMDSPAYWPLSFNSRYPVKRSKVGFKLNMTAFLSLNQNSRSLYSNSRICWWVKWSTSVNHAHSILQPWPWRRACCFHDTSRECSPPAPPRFQSQNMPIPTQKQKLLNVSNLSQNGHSERKKKSKPQEIAKTYPIIHVDSRIEWLVFLTSANSGANHIHHLTKGYRIPVQYSKIIKKKLHPLWSNIGPLEIIWLIWAYLPFLVSGWSENLQTSANQPCLM